MTANIKQVAFADQNAMLPLRGDMAVALDIIPDTDFEVGFVTQTTDQFSITSALAPIRQQDGSYANTFTFGGARFLFVILAYNLEDGTWEISLNNLTALGGSGNGLMPEVEIFQDSSGHLDLDYAKIQSNNMRVTLTSSAKFLNPVNFPAGMDILISIRQDAVGGYAASWGTEYGMVDSQPATIAVNPHALSMVRLHKTVLNNADAWIVEVTPDSVAYPNGFGVVSVLADIGTKEYYQMGTANVGLPSAMTDIKDGQTIVVLRNGRGMESTGVINCVAGAKYYIQGAPVGLGPDFRPQLQLMHTNRPAYGKALLNFEGPGGTVVVRDLKVDGARNVSSDARGICHNSDGVNLELYNVQITDCNNGILTGNQTMVGNTYMEDVVIDKCGIGGPTDDPTHGYTTSGFTHSVYFGHNGTTVRMLRVSLLNAIEGDNLKTRSHYLFADQVLCTGSLGGRELEIPNGGWAELTNCIFWKQNQSGTGNMIMVGGNGDVAGGAEGLDTTRTRKYKFTNCRLRSDYLLNGRDAMLICNVDPEVPLEFIDCEFLGPPASNNGNDPSGQPIYAGTVTVNGIRYMPSAPPIYTYTGGPVGPVLPVGARANAPMSPLPSN